MCVILVANKSFIVTRETDCRTLIFLEYDCLYMLWYFVEFFNFYSKFAWKEIKEEERKSLAAKRKTHLTGKRRKNKATNCKNWDTSQRKRMRESEWRCQELKMKMKWERRAHSFVRKFITFLRKCAKVFSCKMQKCVYIVQ